MKWRYQPVYDDDGSTYLIEIHFDDNDKFHGWTEGPAYPVGNDVRDLQADICRKLIDSYSWKPVMVKDLKPGMEFERAISTADRESIATLAGDLCVAMKSKVKH